MHQPQSPFERGSARRTLRGLALLTCVIVAGPVALNAQRVAKVQGKERIMNLTRGVTDTVEVLVTDSRGAAIPLERAKPVFESLDTTIVVVNRTTGAIYGVATGRADVKISAGTPAKTGFVNVRVDEAAPSVPPAPSLTTAAPRPTPAAPPPGAAGAPVAGGIIRLESARLQLIPGESVPIGATLARPDGSRVPDAHLTYVEGSRRTAAVDTLLGTVTAGEPGEASVIITSPGAENNTLIVQVDSGTARISADTIHLMEGASDTVRLVVPSQNNRAYRGAQSFWTSDRAVVQVDSARGIILRAAAGSATITVRGASIEARTVVRVYPRAMASGPVPPDSVFPVLLGTPTEFPLRGITGDGGTPFAIPAAWRVGDTTVVGFDAATARLLPRSVGTTTLTALPRIRGLDRPMTWKINVIGGRVTVDPQTLGLRVGETRFLRGSLLDSLNNDTHYLVPLTWTSNHPEVVRVNEKNEFVATGIGRALLTGVTSWGSSASVTVFGMPDMLLSVAKNATSLLYWYSQASRTVTPPLGEGGAVKDLDPSIAPDRSHIAYRSTRGNRNGEYQLWVMDPDGANGAQLTPASGSSQGGAAWSRDGTSLFFPLARQGRSRIYTMQLSGTEILPVTDSVNPATAVATSRDGKWLAFETQRKGQYDIYALPLAADGVSPSGPERPVAATPNDDEKDPHFLPDGNVVYVLAERGGKRGRHLMKRPWGTEISTPLTAPEVYVQDYAISADGQTAAVIVPKPGDKNGRTALYLIDLRAGVMPLGPPAFEDQAGNIGTPAFVP